MNTLIKKIETTGNFRASGICISQEPKHVFGLQFLLHTRLLFFKESGGQFHIDFKTQSVKAHSIYAIPPFHFQHLSKNVFQDFICVDIDNRLLKNHHKRLLYLLKYHHPKSLQYEDSTARYSYEDLLEWAKSDDDQELLVDTIMSWIENCLPAKVKQKHTKSRSIQDADHFLSLLSKSDFTFDSFKVSKLAMELFLTERNLHRICTNVFGKSAKDIIQYHLTAKAVFLLSQSSGTIAEISNELNFSSPAAFARYLRVITGYTPTEIRELITEFGL